MNETHDTTPGGRPSWSGPGSSILSSDRKDSASVAMHFVAIEKKPPFRTGVWKVHADVLAIAQQDNEAGIDRLKRCQETATWPTGYEEPRVFDHV